MFIFAVHARTAGRTATTLVALALAALASPAFAQYTFTNIVDTTITTANGGTFTSLFTPAISGGVVAFRGSYTGGTGTDGIFTSNGTVTTSIARNGTGAGATTPNGGTYITFPNFPTISGNTVAFRSDYTGGTGNVGAFTSNGTVTTSIARNGTGAGATTPNGGTFTNLGDPTISGSTIAFLGSYTNGTGTSGIFTSNGTTTASIVRASNNGVGGSTTPNGGMFTSLGTPTISGGVVAFRGSYTGGTGTDGIFMSNGTVTTNIARGGANGSPTPDGGTFFAFNDPTISGDTVAFSANYNNVTGSRQGIFTHIGGTTSTIASYRFGGGGSATPNGGTFTDVGNPSISGNTVAFRGSYAGGTGTFGIFASTNGVLNSVIREGDVAFDSTITSLQFGRFGIDGDNIAFGYTLANGRSGIGLASLGAVAVPEANAGLLALLALPALGAVAFARRNPSYLGAK
jgi:hypothetical protein